MIGIDFRNAHVALRAVLFGLLCLTAEAAAYNCPQTPSPPRTETYQGFLGRVYELDGQELPYRLYVPENYDAAEAYPLVLYLHHAGLAGSDQNNDSGWDNCVQLTSEIGSGNDYGGVFIHEAVDEDGNPFQTQERYPHFLLAPHADSSAYGFGGGTEGSASRPEHATRPLLMAILDEVQAEFNIDAGRLYVTGISMGCYGTWDIVMRNPDMFAAASPQSCRGDPDTSLLAGLKGMPIWSMCGTNDSYFSGAQAMADGMQEIGATAFTFTAMEGVGHSINDRGYDYPGFIDWMFAQRRESVPPPGVGGTGGMTATSTSGGGASGTMSGTSGGGTGAATAGDQSSSVGGSTAGGASSLTTGGTSTVTTAGALPNTTGSVMPTTTSTVSATSTSVTGFGGTGAVITASTVTSSVGGTAGGESESGCACRTTPVSSRGWLLGAGLTLLGLLCSRRQHRLTARGRLFSGTT